MTGRDGRHSCVREQWSPVFLPLQISQDYPRRMQSFAEVLDWLAKGWVGSLIGLLGVAAAVVTYFLTRQRGLVAYRYTGRRLLGLASEGLPSGIRVFYHDQEIPRLTRSLVVIWNEGEKTITSDDIVSSDPFRLRVQGDGRVLAATVLREARDVSKFTASVRSTAPNEIELGFAFLDSGDGAVVEVLHTSHGRHVDVLGTIRGLPRGLKNLGLVGSLGPLRLRRSLPFGVTPRSLGWSITIIGVLITVGSLSFPSPFPVDGNVRVSPIRGEHILAFAGAAYFLLGTFMVYVSRRRYPRGLHLNDLE